MGASDSDTLRVVLQAEPTSLNPRSVRCSDSRAWGSIFDSLVGFDRQTLQPNEDGLLTGWEQTGPTEWTFDVREDVTFQNGETFDADAAAFTIKELRDNQASILRGYYSIVEDAQAVDGKLRITTVEPYLAMPTLLTNAYALPPEYYAEVTAEGFAKKPVGTGPYELKSYTSGSEITVAKYDDYWRGEPKSTTSSSPGRPRPPRATPCSPAATSTSPSTCSRRTWRRSRAPRRPEGDVGRRRRTASPSSSTRPRARSATSSRGGDRQDRRPRGHREVALRGHGARRSRTR